MSNMSYCRFENTNSDLADCEEALDYENIPANEDSIEYKQHYKHLY